MEYVPYMVATISTPRSGTTAAGANPSAPAGSEAPSSANSETQPRALAEPGVRVSIAYLPLPGDAAYSSGDSYLTEDLVNLSSFEQSFLADETDLSDTSKLIKALLDQLS